MLNARSLRDLFPRRHEVFAWNPRRPVRPGLTGKLIPIRRRVNNFGDLLGPLMVAWVREQRGLTAAAPRGDWQLVSVGSVMHFARDGAVVWGTGVNGKIPLEELRFSRLDVRAVRGPKTAEILKARGITVPAVYGDPGLLAAQVFPHLRREPGTRPRFRVAVVRSLNDRAAQEPIGERDIVLDPLGDVEHVLWGIANSELVVSSSLHGLVVADSYGVPSRMLLPEKEHRFKYDDYYLGTGRSGIRAATSLPEALELGGEPPAQCDPQPLLDAFPADLWAPRA